MKKILLLGLFLALGLSSFSQFVVPEKPQPVFSPNEITFVIRTISQDSPYIYRPADDLMEQLSVKVLFGKKVKELTPLNVKSFQKYKGKIFDSMKFVIDSPDYEQDTFVFHKKILYNPYKSFINMLITPKGKHVNKIVILGDAVDVHVGGEKYSYSVSELGRENNDAKGYAQMILKIPDLSVKDYVVYVKNQPIRHIFFDGNHTLITGKATDKEGIGHQVLKELQDPDK